MVGQNSSIRRTPRIARTRRRTNYREPDSDSDFDVPSSPKRFPIRSSRRVQTYHENSGSESNQSIESSDSEEKQNATEIRLSSVPTRIRPKRKRHTRNDTTSTLAFRSFKRQKVNSGSTFDKDSVTVSHVAHAFIPPLPSEPIPPWQTLEYQILLNIMQYASYPLYTGPSRDSGSIKWLLDTSELCTSFHEACIGALMYSPPLLPSPRAHWLLNLLRASARQFDPTDDDRASRRSLSLDYRKKIKRLDIEVKQLLIKKKGIQLRELLSLTPLLSELRLYHNHDELGAAFIWAQPRYSKDRWTYEEMFEILDSLQIRLKAFEWNGRFLRDDPSLATLRSIHSRVSFASLRKVTFLNLNVNNLEKEADRLEACKIALIGALYDLYELADLGFRSCNILDSNTLTQLPSNLRRISFSQCPHITSVGLHEYLTNAGRTLSSLEVSGNQVLDMGFMPDLKELCPYLQHLTMDLNFSDPTSYKDTEPLFDELLPNGSPTWPETLSTIVLGPLRVLSAEDAEGFYQSLIDASSDLSHLRVLVVKTLLKDISWRDRAKMRSKWLALFEDTFLAHTSTPQPPSGPISQANKNGLNHRPIKSSGKRKSTRLRDLEEVGVLDSQNGAFHPSIVNVQPNCNIVVFELSDQRPAQDQYTERDFLDDEPSDDGDWNGRDTETMVPRYSARHYGW